MKEALSLLIKYYIYIYNERKHSYSIVLSKLGEQFEPKFRILLSYLFVITNGCDSKRN